MSEAAAVRAAGAGSARAQRTLALAQVYGVWIALGVLVLYGAAAVPDFATWTNADNLVRAAVPVGIAALGQTFVIAAGGIDLSVGQAMGLVTVLANGIMNGREALVPEVVLLGIGLGLAIGLVNGLLVVTTHIHPMILTFGMLSVLQGAIFLYTDYDIGASAPSFRSLAEGSILSIPTPFVLLVGLTLLSWVVLRRMSVGRYVVAVGSNEANARKAGIGVSKIKLFVYVVSGLSAGIGGLVLASRLGTGYARAGANIELDAIVAVVLGGTPFTGGRAKVVGTVAGVFVLVTLSSVLNLVGTEPYVQQVIKGVIVIVAIVVYMARRQQR